VLEGYRIVALATYIPAPVAAARLRDLGASVVKIEPRRGDPLALAAPAWYAELTRAMEVVTMDLRDPACRPSLDALLSQADLFITAMRASSLSSLKLDQASLRANFPRLSHIALSGEAPPYDDRPGHDLTYQARAGTVAPPAMPRALIGDMAASERIVTAALAALLRRERSGETTHAQVSITDAATAFAQPYVYGLTASTGILGGALATYGSPSRRWNRISPSACARCSRSTRSTTRRCKRHSRRAPRRHGKHSRRNMTCRSLRYAKRRLHT
jgi:alpha-methylacyl-CoA racemase